MKLVATHKGEQNSAAVDPWTAVHFATGLALGLMDVPRRWSFAGSIAYELVEQVVERRRWGQELFRTRRAETLPNALVDFAVFALGDGLGRRWNRTDEPDPSGER